MKRILMVSNMYPSKKYPHYGVFVENTAKILINEGYDVRISAMNKSNNRIVKTLLYLKFYIGTVIKIILNNYNYIYIHYASHSSIPVLFASKIKKNFKIVTNVHGNDVVPESAKDEKFLKYSKKILDKSTYVICPSVYFFNVIKHKYQIEENKIIVYPSGGVNLNVFKPCNRSTVRQELGLRDGRYLGYISRIEKDKGYDIFLEACSVIKKKYHDINIIVVGDGEEIGRYNRLVSEYNLDNEIIKYDLLPQQEIAKIFNVLDVFVFPSYRKSESLGLVGIEAMACGTLTVLPNKYGPSSYGIDGVNSFVFESGDVDSLVLKIEQALEYKNKQIISYNARKTASTFSSTIINDSVIKCFKD